jgi:transcriptional regulator
MAKEVAAPVVTGESGGSLFERYAEADVLDLIREYPLAWVCPTQGSAMESTLLPLLAEIDAAGRLRSLIGHMARRNPLFRTLSANPHALILFTGPQAYVSPAYVSDATWGPTWNYAQARIEATIRFDPDAGDEALSKLVTAMERGMPSPWTTEQMAARYRPMERAIIAFRAEVTSCQARFKLGQDEKPERLREILVQHPDAALVRWMRRFNSGRATSP